MNRVGAVVIGRNEGEKLRRCLLSVLDVAKPVVFVDSGSDDGSVDRARALSVEVLELDRSAPFTVARARNAGLARLTALAPEVEFVQFVDADSEMVASWFPCASRELSGARDLAIVFGRTEERDPRRSIYHRLYQAEFDAQAVRPDICGGMSMARVKALQEVDAFRSDMVGFEDHELCHRLHRAGWRVVRLDVAMVVHEAAMTRFTQWWQRQVRAGYARAHEAALHAGSPERYRVRQCRSVWFWGWWLPLLAILPAAPTAGRSLGLLAGYPALLLRIYRRLHGVGLGRGDAALFAAACVLAKFPQALGQSRFHLRRMGARMRQLPPPESVRQPRGS